MTTVTHKASVFLGLICLLCVETHAAPLKVTFTFPERNTTTSLEQMRYAGYTSPGATLTINGIPRETSSIGAFAGLLSLSVGENVLTAEASVNGASASARLEITREPPLAPIGTEPWQIDKNSCSPQAPVWILPPGSLPVRFRGSPGGIATFSIGPHKDIAMIESSPGIYESELMFRFGETFDEGKVQFELTREQGYKKATATAKGPVTLLGTGSPIILETHSGEPVPLYRTADGRTRYVDLPSEVRLEAVGRMQSRYEVALSPQQHAFVDTATVLRLPDGTPRPKSALTTINTELKQDRTVVRIPLSARLPYRITELIDPPRLELRIFGAKSDLWWITQRYGDRTVASIRENPDSDGTCCLVIGLKQDHWGYWIDYDKTTLCLEILAPPNLPDLSQGRLRGLVVAVDPGHGGKNVGARSSSGVYEKDLNRELGIRLEQKIRSLGAETVIVRQGDETVSLQERVNRARRSGADILISIHNNTVGESTDPASARGVSVYSCHPHSEQIAKTVFDRLAGLPNLEPWAYITGFDFKPIRGSTDMLGFLVECAFLSHLGDEEWILSTEAQDRVTQAICDGVIDFLQQRPTVSLSNND
ncbi:MAG TPA: N-acetylmuramoyl-L-alanine amidase [bacterium]|nr:N-acetylmuramoyl-L-alanine amidase [bacterium]HQL62937.1 N-acetylmuramoyl-L-alanine amidase [bacterium]